MDQAVSMPNNYKTLKVGRSDWNLEKKYCIAKM